MYYLKYCKECAKRKVSLAPEKYADFYAGYLVCYVPEKISNIHECPQCGSKELSETNITEEELDVIGVASNYNPALLDAMRELKEKDVIEYELKMSQFRNQANQMDAIKRQEREDNRPRCPHCNGTNIQSIGTGERIGSVIMFGMFSKKMNKSFKCLDCKYTW